MIVSYVNQDIDNIKNNYMRDRDTLHTDVTEIKAFTGLLLLVGLFMSGRLNLDDLWNTRGFGLEIFHLHRFRFL